MQRIMRSLAVLVILVVVLGLSLIDAGAQTRRKRRPRRAPRPVVTNPTITPSEESASGEPKVISTADETPTDPLETTKPRKKKTADSDEGMQDTINALSNQINRLNDKLTEMQSNDRSLLDMERLTRAEQRAESLRNQQLEVETRLADLQSQMDQMDYALKPENIERVTSGYGTTRPEEARDSRRRQLESEKGRLQAQIRILETSRARLETAVANADTEVEALRRRLQQNDATPSVVESQPARTPKPEQ
jgi:chromosome segregation ATPase